jgi:hypothetical protein
MAFGTGFVCFLVTIAAIPLPGIAFGGMRTKTHILVRRRFTKMSLIIAGSYFSTLVATYATIYLLYYVQGRQFEPLAMFGCALILTGPVVALAIVGVGESLRHKGMPGFCAACGYPVGSNDKCTECGTAIARAAPPNRQPMTDNSHS